MRWPQKNNKWEDVQMEPIEQLKQWVKESKRIVFFGGAGVSTESGIPDFRSVDGLYNQKYKFPPETILSHTFYKKHTKEFFEFYKDKMIFQNATPNKGHLKLADLEKAGRLSAIVTQNIDGLHQLAGSEEVYELHGSVLRNYCESCHTFYPVDYMAAANGIPTCSCGGTIKPDVVLYEEGLDSSIMEKSVKAITNADMLIIGGTSLSVYPAAGLIQYYRGDRLVLINKTSTPMDNRADLLIQARFGEVMDQIKDDEFLL